MNNSNFILAVISDIHGNSFALREVLKDIDARGITNIVNLGDSLYGPIDPAGTADLIIERNITSVIGNEDRILIEDTNGGDHSPSLQFTMDQLKKYHFDWLGSLTKTKIVFNKLIMFHGTFENDSEYLLNNIYNSRLILKSKDEIKNATVQIEQEVILCGHDHTPNIIYLDNGKLILNPGSVGCPAYYDETDPPHAVETGSPFARYSIIYRNDSGWQVNNIALIYNWDAAARIALKNGRPDWVKFLKFGRIN